MNNLFATRIIYLLLFSVLMTALICGFALPPTRIDSAEKAFHVVENLPSQKNDKTLVALIGMEYGPGTQAENDPQARVIIEHLFRRKIPIIFFTGYALAERYVIDTPTSVAAKINQQDPELNLMYGQDWVTIGYRPGGAVFLQALSQSNSLGDYLGKDINGISIKDYQNFSGLKTLEDISLVAHFSGLSGMLNTYIQFLRYKGIPPTMIHGCTSISIPEAFIFIESGQLKGLLEGVAGAAWYANLLKNKYDTTELSDAEKANSTLGIGQVFVLALILLGNLIALYQTFLSKKRVKV